MDTNNSQALEQLLALGYEQYGTMEGGTVLRKYNSITSTYDHVLIKDDVPANATVSIYQPGSDGAQNDAPLERTKNIFANQDDAQIMLIAGCASADDNGASVYTYNNTNGKYYGIIDEVTSAYGVDDPSLVATGYSMSYDSALKGAANVAISNPDANPITINLVDGSRGNGDPGLQYVQDLTQEQLNALRDNGAVVNIVEKSGETSSQSVASAVEYLRDNGVDVNVYYSSSDDHGQVNSDAFSSGVVTGNIDDTSYSRIDQYIGSNRNPEIEIPQIPDTTQGQETTPTTPGQTTTPSYGGGNTGNNVQYSDLSKYAVSSGETSTKYIIPAGEYGNNTGRDIELVIPNEGSQNLKLYGQIDADAKLTWSDIESSLLNKNESSVVVKLSPGGKIGRTQAAESNAAVMEYVSQITDIDSAKIAGASNASVYALDLGAQFANNPDKYNLKIEEVAWLDYLNKNEGVRTYELSSMLSSMAAAGIGLVGITDTEISTYQGTGYAISQFYKYGGVGRIYQYSRVDTSAYKDDPHRAKCAHGSLAYFGIETNAKFSQYSDYINGEFVVTEYDSTFLLEETAGSGSDTVSVDYQFVLDRMSSLFALINNSSISNKNSIGMASSGSATFEAANIIFNTYAVVSIEFLNSLGETGGNIITMAESLNELDATLANAALDDAAAYLDGVSLTKFNDFYDDIPNLDFLAPYKSDDGTLKITKDSLFAAMSDSNIILSSLMNDIADTQELQAQLDSFMSDSTKNLQGSAWDKMRSVIDEYSTTCQKKINYCNNLIESMRSAYQRLLDHMEEFDELDMSKMGEIEQGIIDMTNQINMLESLIKSTPDYEDIYGIDAEGKTVKIGVRDNTALKNSWRATKLVCLNIKARLEKNLQKLQELPGVDAQAADEILQNETETPESPMATPIPAPSPGPVGPATLDTEELENNDNESSGNNGGSGASKEETPTGNESDANTLTNDQDSSSSTQNDENPQPQNNSPAKEETETNSQNTTNNQDSTTNTSNNNQENTTEPSTNQGNSSQSDNTIGNNNYGDASNNNTSTGENLTSNDNLTTDNQLTTDDNLSTDNTTIVDESINSEQPTIDNSTTNNSTSVETPASSETTNDGSNILKTIGVAAGVAGVAAAGVYGAKAYQKKKNESEGYEYNNHNNSSSGETGLDNFE